MLLAPLLAAETWYRDQAYGSDPLQTLDLVVPDTAEACPLLIIIHGGGLVGGDKSVPWQIYPVVQQFLSRGIAVASLNYRLAPANRFPAQLCACREAIAFLIANRSLFHIDSTRLGIWGHSSGSQLGLLLEWTGNEDFPECPALDDFRGSIRVAVSGDTPVDLIALGRWFYQPFIPGNHPGLARRASPVLYADRNAAVPNLLIHAYRDALIPYSQSVSLGLALFRTSPTTLMLVDNADHCLLRIDPTQPTIPSEAEIDSVILDHVYRYLFPQRAGDANYDGQVDELDYDAMLGRLGGFSMTSQGAPFQNYRAACDLDDNGRIDSADAVLLLQKLLSLDIIKPAEAATVRMIVPVQAQFPHPGVVRGVDLLVDGSVQASLSSIPYEFAWDSCGVANGPHTLTVRAQADYGQTAERSVSVQVRNIRLELSGTRREARSWIVRRDYADLELTIDQPMDGDIASFVLQRSSNGSPWIDLQETVLDQLNNGSFRWRGDYIDKNVTYTYRVEARDRAGTVLAVSPSLTL